MQKESPRIKNFIDGKFAEPGDGKYLDNIEPATGKVYSQVADSGKEDVDLAVAAAEKAFVDWSKKPAAERSQILLRIADLIDRDLEKLARRLGCEQFFGVSAADRFLMDLERHTHETRQIFTRLVSEERSPPKI